MIDFSFANKNISQYIYDYDGYLVVVDQIRCKDMLLEKAIYKQKSFLQETWAKYNAAFKIIAIHDNHDFNDAKRIFKMSKKQVIDELNYTITCLPVVGFILLGKGKEIGII